jgi:tripartite-type tricarboxylate transporter receptor subunit TctC
VSLFENLNYDALKDFAAVTLLARTPSILAVNPALPAKTVGDLITLARGKPGKINYAGGVTAPASSRVLPPLSQP